MSNSTAILFDLQRSSFVDGPGIRTTVFFKGCNLRCAWCHNPESQAPKSQMMFYKNKCTGCGRCRDISENDANFVCFQGAREICGKEYTVDQVMKVIRKDQAFYESSGGGVTFSGGECMLQIDFLKEILGKCKEEGIHTAIDTAGHLPYEHFEAILPFTDLFLYDVKCYDSDMHKAYTGVSNERILSNLKGLLETDKTVWVRIPIIPTVNDNEEELWAIKHFLLTCRRLPRVELLPFHAMGEHKYAALGRAAPRFSPPSEETMRRLQRIFD